MAGYNHFPQISEELQNVLGQVVSKTAMDIQARAASQAPVDTGFLRNSIHTESGENDLTAYVIVGANYGVYVELGTRFMPAQPYFFPAVEAARGPFESAISAIESRLS